MSSCCFVTPRCSVGVPLDRVRISRYNSPTASAITASATPTPMPAFAPILSLLPGCSESPAEVVAAAPVLVAVFTAMLAPLLPVAVITATLAPAAVLACEDVAPDSAPGGVAEFACVN
jgi:hypothetical protein